MSANVGFRCAQQIIRLLLPIVIGVVTSASEQLPRIEANPNHAPAGEVRDGVLTIWLEIAKAEWHPEADDGMSLSVYAFGEAGHPLQNPGPLIRVPQGTEIHASVHNTLTVPVAIHALGDHGDSREAVLRVEPGATEQVTFK